MPKTRLSSLMIVFLMISASFHCQPAKPLTREDLNRALLDAAYGGSAKKVKELLQKGADINTKNEFGSTPFRLAVVGDNVNVVELFLKLGQDPNRESDKAIPDGTPLMSAAANGNVKLLKLLLRYGAKPDYPTSGKATALMSAIGHTEIFEILINHGANIHARDNYGRTVLIWAALHCTEEVVTLLCKIGADPEIKDNGGNTALTQAKNKGRSRIVELLTNCSKNRAPN